MSGKVLIYVKVGGSILHWHPVQAVHEHETCYRIIDKNPDPEHFYWLFSFNDVVRCEENKFAENEFGLIAVEKCKCAAKPSVKIFPPSAVSFPLQSVFHLYIIGMEFEWDENKNLANIKNHEGVSFEDAMMVFEDVFSIEDFDESHSVSEARFSVIGLSEYTLLRVVFTYRETASGEQTIRIISAWRVTGKDKETYEKARNELDN